MISKSMLADGLREGFDVSFGSCPGGDEADGGFGLAAGPPEFKRHRLPKSVNYIVGKYEKLLIGIRVNVEGITMTCHQTLDGESMIYSLV